MDEDETSLLPYVETDWYGDGFEAQLLGSGTDTSLLAWAASGFLLVGAPVMFLMGGVLLPELVQHPAAFMAISAGLGAVLGLNTALGGFGGSPDETRIEVRGQRVTIKTDNEQVIAGADLRSVHVDGGDLVLRTDDARIVVSAKGNDHDSVVKLAEELRKVMVERPKKGSPEAEAERRERAKLAALTSRVRQ